MTDDSDADAPGWYPDPAGVHHQRYWSGEVWTARVADAYGVMAVHHVEQVFAPPGGGPPRVAPAPAKPPTPSLSLVEPIATPIVEPVAEPVVGQVAERVVAQVVEPREVAVTEPSASPGRPQPPGWYPDPSGIHCERSWDGNEWSDVAVDRNGALLTHAIIGRFAGPEPDVSPRARTPAPLASELVPASGDGWQSDTAARFRERYFVDGRPSSVVRTLRRRIG